MFSGGGNKEYDEIVAKTTDENLTTENWELILNLCDKVQDEGTEGARAIISSLLKRLSHRNPTVQLYTLSLTDALSKNCGMSVKREIASRAFTMGLEKLILDRNTHEKVRKRTLALIAQWTEEWGEEEGLEIMEECYAGLKQKGYKFDAVDEPPPPSADDEIRRREEEELALVMEMSMKDRGGRGGYSSQPTLENTGYSSSWPQQSGSGSSSSSFNPSNKTSSSPKTTATTSGITSGIGTMSLASTGSTTSLNSIRSTKHISNRVRALHAFTPTEPGELAFSAGDVITVVDRNYKDWWRGQLRGRTGIFPVNYVEVLPPPDEAELAREAQQEANVFAEAANVERLLEMLRDMDRQQQEAQSAAPGSSLPRLADNDELQELYRSCMALRPKIVKLIEKYSQKRADLVSMNDTFLRARTIFDRMMEESLASYGAGNFRYSTGRPPQGFYQALNPGNPGSPGGGFPQQPYPGLAQGPAQGPVQGIRSPMPGLQGVTQTAGQPANAYDGAYGPQAQIADQPVGQGQPVYGPEHVGLPQNHQVQGQPQSQLTSPPPQQPAPVQQSQLQHHPSQQTQPSLQSQSIPDQQQPSGPPYIFDPSATYPDPNVQAWAQYYAKGGTDPTGSVYFIHVPGVKDDTKLPEAEAPTQQQQQQQQQSPATQTHPSFIAQTQPYAQGPNSYGASPYAVPGAGGVVGREEVGSTGSLPQPGYNDSGHPGQPSRSSTGNIPSGLNLPNPYATVDG